MGDDFAIDDGAHLVGKLLFIVLFGLISLLRLNRSLFYPDVSDFDLSAVLAFTIPALAFIHSLTIGIALVGVKRRGNVLAFVEWVTDNKRLVFFHALPHGGFYFGLQTDGYLLFTVEHILGNLLLEVTADDMVHHVKAILFRNCDTGVVNADDPWTGRLMENASCKVLTYSEKAESDLRAENVSLGADHIAFTAVTKEKKVPIRVNIPGGFMVYNTLDVLGAALALGVSLEKSAEVLAGVPHVKGRVEVVPTPGKDYTILIDYAHSPDGLENVLSSVKGFAKGRTIALFGCGGDRDKTKRPKMGKVAADLADFAIVTTDNPRTEVPADIIRDILPGFEGSDTPYIVVEDRIQAIHWAMDHAEKGDVIVLCGKGHETYQEINHVKHHMDEREIVADYLNAGK